MDTYVFVVIEGKACIQRRRPEVHKTMMGVMVIMMMVMNSTDDASFIKHIPWYGYDTTAKR